MTIPNPLRRFTPTPLTADLCVMGRAVRLETDSATLLEYIRRNFESTEGRRPSPPEFLWRLVSEPDAGFEARQPKMAGFSDTGLALVNFGQRSFIAIDLDGREAVGFLEERFTKDEPGFVRLSLNALITLTAPALGLPAASVVRGAGKTERSIFLRHPGDV